MNDVTEVGPGDYVKVEGQWKRIVTNSAYQARPLPRNWIIRTEDGGQYDMWQIERYARSEG